jgi:hypothetical protein
MGLVNLPENRKTITRPVIMVNKPVTKKNLLAMAALSSIAMTGVLIKTKFSVI